jgi:hypothetical protein
MALDPLRLNAAQPLTSAAKIATPGAVVEPAASMGNDNMKLGLGGLTTSDINTQALENYSLPANDDAKRLSAVLKSAANVPLTAGPDKPMPLDAAYVPAAPLKLKLSIETELSNGFKLQVDPTFKHGGGLKVGLHKTF